MLQLPQKEPRALREAREEGRKQGRVEGALSFVLRQLKRRLGAIPDELLSQIQVLPLAQIEALAEALLDFATVADLEGWFQQNFEIGV
jgi:predicted transposase YdaD